MLQTVNSFKPFRPSLPQRLISQLADGLDPDKNARQTAAAKELEAEGPLVWLTTMFPWIFRHEFSPDHKEFWKLWWSLLLRLRQMQRYRQLGLPAPARCRIGQHELVIFLLLGRALGKSAMVEVSSVMRGAMLDGGYSLYICETGDQAEEHLGNQKQLIEHPDSRLVEFYPGMEIAENATIDRVRAKDRSDIFVCQNGWIARAKGLTAKLRGLRIGGVRPDDISIDDIDDVEDSIAVSVKKLKRLLASVAPLIGSDGFATFKVGQNLILETGVVNQLHTGKAAGFVERTTIGVSNTFEDFRAGIEYETYLDEDDGRVKHRILPAAKPTWAGVSIETAQQFLNNSGLEVFLAEYQNQFEHLKTDRVFPAYDERRHIIEWSDFQRVFGKRYIPAHWGVKVSADFGYSKKSLSAWMFNAVSAKNSPLPAHYFCYRSLTFTEKSIDDQAIAVWESMFPDLSVGKRHFEATQAFANYPELFRLLKTKDRCSPYMQDEPQPPSRRIVDPFPHPEPSEEDSYWRNVALQNFAGQIKDWVISHEKTGEQKTLAQKYGLPVNKTKDFGASDGRAEANHLLRGDMTKPHPFFEDEKLPNGLYKLGRPFLYFIVEDGQKLRPVNDAGMSTAREQIANQRMTEEKLGTLGLSRSIPMKFESDHGDAFRMFAASYAIPNPTPLSIEEEIEELIPDSVRPKPDAEGKLHISKAEQQRMEYARAIAEEVVKNKYGEDVFEDDGNEDDGNEDDAEFGDWW